MPACRFSFGSACRCWSASASPSTPSWSGASIGRCFRCPATCWPARPDSGRPPPMKLYYCDSVQGNFGDDLNQWLWPRLLPGMWNDDDGVIFVGIGTILGRDVPAARIRAVFGSGAGYALVPDIAARDGNWHIYGVRGPLTARVL